MFSRKCRAVFASTVKGAAYLVPAVGSGVAFSMLAALTFSPSGDMTLEGKVVVGTFMGSALAACADLGYSAIRSFGEAISTYRFIPAAEEPLLAIEVDDLKNEAKPEAPAAVRNEHYKMRPLYCVLGVTTSALTFIACDFTWLLAHGNIEDIGSSDGIHPPNTPSSTLALLTYCDISLFLATLNFWRKTCMPPRVSEVSIFSRNQRIENSPVQSQHRLNV